MNFLLLVTAMVSLSFVDGELTPNKFSDLKFDLTKDFVEDLLLKLEDARDSGITAEINEYTDKILANIKIFAIKNGLDPVALPNITQKFLTASITLTNGSLTGIATLQRNGDVTVNYNSNSRKLKIVAPIQLYDLKFDYNYHVIILLIGPSGMMHGKITNFSLKFTLVFDFNEYHASLESFSLTNTGHIDVTFSGNGLIDIVVNILSEFVTTILHPLIVGIIEGIIKGVLNNIIGDINSIIDHILHPNMTTIASVILS